MKKNVQNFTVVKSSHTIMDRTIERFSSWMELKKCVAWLLCLCKNVQEKVKRDKTTIVTKQESTKSVNPSSLCGANPLSVDELKWAEKEIVKFVQKKSFQEEINSLTGPEASKTARRPGIKKTSVIYKLDPTMIDGILCVGGCLTNAPITEESKHYVIIPKE